jgi:hypothetical protein
MKVVTGQRRETSKLQIRLQFLFRTLLHDSQTPYHPQLKQNNVHPKAPSCDCIVFATGELAMQRVLTQRLGL